MAEETQLTLQLTIREAALIKYIRGTHSFTNITITKIDGRIERVRNEELHTIKDLAKEFGLIADPAVKTPLDKQPDNGIVE